MFAAQNVEKLINSATATADYSVEAIASYNATGDDKMDELQARFEATIGDYETVSDVGGIVEYYTGAKLVAYYDYENFKGTVFAQ